MYKDKFIILCMPRSGSTLLHEKLNQHSRLKVVGEIYNSRFNYQFGIEDKVELLDHVFKYAHGCKIMFNDISNDQNIIKYILDNNIKIIRLIRNNRIAQLYSLKLATISDKWFRHKFSNILNSVLYIPLKELFDHFNKWRYFVNTTSELFDNIIDVTYEDLSLKTENTYTILCEKLGIKPEFVFYSTYDYSVTRPVSLLIENWYEIENTLSSEKYSQYHSDIKACKTFYTFDWFSHNIPLFERFLSKFKNKPCRFLEIGGYQGMSSIWMAENILVQPHSHIITIDNGATCNIEGFSNNIIIKENILNSGNVNKIFLLESSSDIMKNTLGNFDFIYVDGAHNEEQVYLDCIRSFRDLKLNGIMAMDDYGMKHNSVSPSPKLGIDRFLEEYSDKISILHKKYQVWIEKIA